MGFLHPPPSFTAGGVALCSRAIRKWQPCGGRLTSAGETSYLKAKTSTPFSRSRYVGPCLPAAPGCLWGKAFWVEETDFVKGGSDMVYGKASGQLLTLGFQGQ